MLVFPLPRKPVKTVIGIGDGDWAMRIELSACTSRSETGSNINLTEDARLQRT